MRSANLKKGVTGGLIVCSTVYWAIRMQTCKSAESLLSEVSPSKAIMNLAVPAALVLLANAVYNIVDTAYIGLLDSGIALAAVGVTLPLLLIMCPLKTSLPPERQLGANEKVQANQTVGTIVGFSLFAGIGLCVMGILFMDPLLRAFYCFFAETRSIMGRLGSSCISGRPSISSGGCPTQRRRPGPRRRRRASRSRSPSPGPACRRSPAAAFAARVIRRRR